MSTLSILLIGVIALSLALLGYILLSIARLSRTNGSGPEQLDDPADRQSLLDYYRPMLLLLDARELERARLLTGTSPEDWRRFRRARIQSFRAYLGDMRLDFQRLEFKLRYFMLAASAEEGRLVTELNRLKLQYFRNLLLIEARLALFEAGLGTVDPTPLLEAIEVLESSLNPGFARSVAASAA